MTPRSTRLVLAAVAALALPALNPAVAAAQDPAAVQAAQDGYDRLGRGDAAGAAQAAQRAVNLSPDTLDYRLLWADALLRAQRPAEIFRACGAKPQCARCVCDMRKMIGEHGEALRYAAE